MKTLTRTCTNPLPSNGGKDCRELGPAEKTAPCNEKKGRKYLCNCFSSVGRHQLTKRLRIPSETANVLPSLLLRRIVYSYMELPKL